MIQSGDSGVALRRGENDADPGLERPGYETGAALRLVNWFRAGCPEDTQAGGAVLLTR